MDSSLHVAVPPPVVFGIILLSGLGLGYLFPVRLFPESLTFRLMAGGATCIVGASIGAWALLTFRYAQVTPDFGSPVAHLLENGPYRYSRNPLYLALSIVLLGFSILLNTAWLLLGVPVLLFVLSRTVVVKEEHYLRTRFGERYISYSRNVRRWL